MSLENKTSMANTLGIEAISDQIEDSTTIETLPFMLLYATSIYEEMKRWQRFRLSDARKSNAQNTMQSTWVAGRSTTRRLAN